MLGSYRAHLGIIRQENPLNLRELNALKVSRYPPFVVSVLFRVLWWILGYFDTQKFLRVLVQLYQINLIKSELGCILSSEHKSVRMFIETADIVTKNLQTKRI